MPETLSGGERQYQKEDGSDGFFGAEADEPEERGVVFVVLLVIGPRAGGIITGRLLHIWRSKPA